MQPVEEIAVPKIPATARDLENEIIYTADVFKAMPILRWQKVGSIGKKYTPRTGHECIYYRDKIYLFGGTDHDDRKNDLYSYDIFYSRWDKLLQQGDIPSPRSGARGVAYKDCLYFFGGYSKQSGEYYNDLFRYDLDRRRWDSIETTGDKPSSRTDHSLVIYGSSLYVFGGYDGSKRYGDLLKCSILKNYKWK